MVLHLLFARRLPSTEQFVPISRAWFDVVIHRGCGGEEEEEEEKEDGIHHTFH